MLVLVVYDISSNTVRQELANYLKSKGFIRLQRSFFAGRPPPGVLRDVERTLPRFIKAPNRDVIHLVPVYSVDAKNVRVYGRALADIVVVGKLIVIP